MKRLAIFTFVVACACGGATAKPTANVAVVPVHARTLEERRADVCARSDLAPASTKILGAESKVDPLAIVRSVSVRDPSNTEVVLRGETTAAIHVGAPLTDDIDHETIRRVWQTGKFDDVAIETEKAEDGIAVVVRVVPKRTIANVFVSGDAQPDGLHVLPGAPYDAVAIASAKRAVLQFEKSEGHLDAKLDVSSASADAASLDVCVKLLRGPRVTIDAVVIHGSAFDSALKELLAKEDTSNVPDHVIEDAVLDRDELVLAAELYNRGLLSHAIKRTTQRHGNSITIDFAVTDGPTFRYGLVDVSGDLVAPKGDYMKLVTLKQGDVFNRTDVMAVLEKMRALHKAAKKEDIEVEPETDLDTQNQTVAIHIAIHDPHATHAATLPTPTGGFSVVDLKHGTGLTAKVGDTVSVHYKGTLKSGKVFDDSHGRSPFTFTIGKGTVIKGFDAGVTGMKVGGKRRVTIPPDMGYGSRTTGNIPAGSTLVFEIELLSIP